jgi:hypothetical protein
MSASPSPPPTPALPPMSDMKKALLNVCQFLMAVGQTQAPGHGVDITQSFVQTVAQVQVPTAPDRLHAFIQQISAIPGNHLLVVLSGLNEEVRTYFQGQILELSESVKTEMPDVGESAIMLKLLIQQFLPAISGLPEEAVLGTLPSVRQNYGILDKVSQIIKPPEDMTPKLLELEKSKTAYAEARQQYDKLANRFAARGFDISNEKGDEIVIKSFTTKNSNSKIAVIILSVVVVVLIIAIIAVSVSLFKKKDGSSTNMNNGNVGVGVPSTSQGFNGPANYSFGGISGGVGGGGGTAAMFNFPSVFDDGI